MRQGQYQNHIFLPVVHSEQKEYVNISSFGFHPKFDVPEMGRTKYIVPELVNNISGQLCDIKMGSLSFRSYWLLQSW